jgi:hypothetical protein
MLGWADNTPPNHRKALSRRRMSEPTSACPSCFEPPERLADSRLLADDRKQYNQILPLRHLMPSDRLSRGPVAMADMSC